MKRQLFIVCLLCLSFDVICERTINFTIKSRDKLFTNNYKYNIDITNPLVCTMKCLEDVETPCLSFAYNALDHKCYLYSHEQFGNSYLDVPGIVTYVPTFDDIEKGKPTSQSETFADNEKKYGSYKAIDGRLNTYMKTTNVIPRWWCVDLLKIHSMRLIQIVNRNFNSQRMKWFRLSFGMTGTCDTAGLDMAVECYRDEGTDKTHYDITKCTRYTNQTEMRARLIFISQYNNSSPMHFSELNILLDYFDNSNCSLID